MSVAWPLVRARLAASLPAVVGAAVTVYDGPVVTGDAPTAYVTVAHQPSTEGASAGTFQQTEGPDGFSASEVGEVLCEVSVATGDPTVPDAFAIYSLIATWLQQDPTLGILVVGSQTGIGAEVLQDQNANGAVQRLLVSINYSADLP